jgi:hypothetical protein
MAKHYAKQEALDAALRDEENGNSLVVFGWTLWLMGAITIVWIFVGWRDGTWFWFWCTAALGLVGAGAAVAGSVLRARSARTFALASDLQRAAEPALQEELPAPKDVGPRAA